MKAVSYLSFSESKTLVLNYLNKFPDIKIEYLEWVDANSFERLFEKEKDKSPALCVAAWVEGIRLIDNATL